MSRSEPSAKPRRELTEALAKCRGALAEIGILSGVSNLLMLTGSFYMLEVYDRVLPSRSVPTLIGLSVLAITLFSFQGAIDFVRSRLLIRIGASLEESLSGTVFQSIIRLPLLKAGQNDGLQPIRDLDAIRVFVSGNGPVAFFDLPWMPLYIALCFVFHPLLGFTALGGAAALIALTLVTSVLTRRPTAEMAASASARIRIADLARRNAEVLWAMGIGSRLAARWAVANQTFLNNQRRTGDAVGGLGAIARVLRIFLQSSMLGVGALLVIHQEATAGIIIAGSIIAGRAFAPVDLAIANWRNFAAARQSWRRLAALLTALPAVLSPLRLPNPQTRLSVENAYVAAPGTQRVLVQDAVFALKAGSGLGIIGPSASGKSSLARMLVGVWRPVRGSVRLDGAELSQWAPEELGRHIGYLPQDVELIDGTVSENIARFQPDATPEAVVAAAKTARVHDLIVNLPGGYDSAVGENGAMLSAGQRQRIALARAVYGDPFLIVLDEPNSNLDAEGEEALTQTILSARNRGAIVVVVAHRPSALAGVDMVLAMANGRQQAFGPKEEILGKVLRRDNPPITLKLATDAERNGR